MPDSNAIYRRTWWLVAIGCIAPNVLLPVMKNTPAFWIAGLILGTVFTQPILAAAWAAWGPGKVSVRIPQSLMWAVVVGVSLAIGELFMPNEVDVAIFPLLTITLWLMAMVPFSATAIFLDLQLRYQADDRDLTSQTPRQFKIKHVLVFTALIAVLFAWLRLFIQCSAVGPIKSSEFCLWCTLTLHQVVINFPLIGAAVLPRNRRLLLAAVLLGVGGVTILDFWYADRCIGGLGPSEYLGHVFLWNNVASVVWVLIFTAIIRHCGYRLSRPHSTAANEFSSLQFKNDLP
ncbi:hypothetical protein [Anatilimnocola floriformis]|uniref:hypothetical protein n=1 Tax=Anatilimnocola floriformis TaxID=2948575 RepID=UPI0020C230BE|nr:hypothetical protein [Anatilimnocola floriformis]